MNEFTNKDFIWRLLQDNKSKLESLPKVIDKLLDEKYCKENFNLYYPLLRKIEVGISEEEKQRLYLRMDGRSGYYKDDYRISESRFIVCSEWYPKKYPDQRRNTEKWFHLLEQEKPDDSNEDDRINNEIEKIQKRVPKWFNKPNQKNTRILISFMELLGEKDYVDYVILKEECKSIENFVTNFPKMKDFGEKNHGKVFHQDDSRIYLWKPVREFVTKEYKKYLGSTQ